jgi:heme/copper-type cytochrome/quinol oxidase subunit 2
VLPPACSPLIFGLLPKQTHGNNALELTWTAIPTVLVLILFVVRAQR